MLNPISQQPHLQTTQEFLICYGDGDMNDQRVFATAILRQKLVMLEDAICLAERVRTGIGDTLLMAFRRGWVAEARMDYADPLQPIYKFDTYTIQKLHAGIEFFAASIRGFFGNGARLDLDNSEVLAKITAPVVERVAEWEKTHKKPVDADKAAEAFREGV